MPPLIIKPSETSSNLVCIDEGSEPETLSVNPKHPIISPVDIPRNP